MRKLFKCCYSLASETLDSVGQCPVRLMGGWTQGIAERKLLLAILGGATSKGTCLQAKIDGF